MTKPCYGIKALLAMLIFACCTATQPRTVKIPAEVIRDKIKGGWVGQTVGVSYGLPTEFRWQVTRVEILPPRNPQTPPGINYIALRRNEVKEKASTASIKKWLSGKAPPQPIFADVSGKDFWGDDTRGRTQRQTMALKDVHYRLHAHIRPWPGFESRLTAFEEQFRRRASRGKCIYQPYFGCREFPAYFELIQNQPT